MDSTTPGLWRMTFGGIGATLKALQDAGVTLRDMKRIRSDPDLAKKVAAAFLPVIKPTLSQLRARQIMGQGFFGVREAIRHFGIRPTAEQLATLAEVPFRVEVLQESKDTHLLVADFGPSIIDVKAGHPDLFYSEEDAWYSNQGFAKEKGKICWRLVCKDVVPGSTSKTWEQQQALLQPNEEVPRARVMVYAIIGHFLVTGEHLFENVYARCRNLSSDGRRVSSGAFGADGFSITIYQDTQRTGHHGQSSVLNP